MSDKFFKIKRNILPITRGILYRLKYCFNDRITIGSSARIGKNSEISLHPGCICSIGSGLTLGRNVTVAVLSNGKLFIGGGVGISNCNQIVCHGKLCIGDDTIFGPNVMVYDHNHKYDLTMGVNRRMFDVGEVTIGKRCWIGAGAIILKNVHIGDNCIIGAGSVVTKDVPSNSVAAGNPAKIIKTKENELE